VIGAALLARDDPVAMEGVIVVFAAEEAILVKMLVALLVYLFGPPHATMISLVLFSVKEIKW
jgi:hypothetical protein